MKRLACLVLLVAILLSGVFLVRSVGGQTTMGGTLSSNTEWTLSESPVVLNETVTVPSGVTLTIDPGVDVNLGFNQLLVEGTLIAEGNASDKITFTDTVSSLNQTISLNEPIIFSASSTSWNAATDSGSIIQNAVLNGVNLQIDSSPEIDSCLLNYDAGDAGPVIIDSGSPVISNNTLYCTSQSVGIVDDVIQVYSATPLITGNYFEGDLSSVTNIGVAVNSGSPTITGNSFNSEYGNNSVGIKVTSGTAQIANNEFQGSGQLTGIFDASPSSFTVSNNTFSDCLSGINAQAPSILTIEGNTISRGYDGIDIAGGATLTITDNLVDSNSRYGIDGGGNINSNTISNNQIGINNPPTGTITQNNIVGNTLNSVTATIENVNAQYNWWGTTDTATINQTIYDSKVDPRLGTVFFVPFLTAPSTSAPPIPSYTPALTPIPTPTPMPLPELVATPTSTPDQYTQTLAYQIGTLLNLNLITTATAIVLALVWAIVILGYVAKKGVSKLKSKS